MRFSSLLFTLIVLARCAAPAQQGVKTAAGQPVTIDTLAEDYWELSLEHAPRTATSLGDHRYDDKMEDISPAATLAFREVLRGLLQDVQALNTDSSVMSPAQRITRDVLVEALLAELGTAVCESQFWQVDHLAGHPASWAGTAGHQPVSTSAEVEKLLARYRAMPGVMRQHISNLRAGAERGLVASRIVIERQLEQLDQMLSVAVVDSPFVPGKLLDKEPAAEGGGKQRIAGEVERSVYPALDSYRRFLRDELLKQARDRPGIAFLRNGAACYAAQIRLHTGLALTPQEIHAIGLSEVDRINVAMREVMAKIRAKDPKAPTSLPDFVAYLAKRPDQHETTREGLLKHARSVVARAQAALPKVFTRLPKTPLEVQPLEAYRERESPAAYYQGAPADGARPGVYLLNTYGPEHRYLFDGEALAFHEAVPGHHLQIALAQELTDLPEFRKQDGGTAFVEGWALYAEALAKELGLYSSDEAEFGRLGAESWRAFRLVIDTGLHVYGWSREEAIARLQRGSTSSLPEITNEVDRYIAWPGQALGYKLGELEIWRLRRHAETKLGKSFDLRAFHDLVHSAGALPLNVLARRVDKWIEQTNVQQSATFPAQSR